MRNHRNIAKDWKVKGGLYDRTASSSNLRIETMNYNFNKSAMCPTLTLCIENHICWGLPRCTKCVSLFLISVFYGSLCSETSYFSNSKVYNLGFCGCYTITNNCRCIPSSRYVQHWSTLQTWLSNFPLRFRRELGQIMCKAPSYTRSAKPDVRFFSQDHPFVTSHYYCRTPLIYKVSTKSNTLQYNWR